MTTQEGARARAAVGPGWLPGMQAAGPWRVLTVGEDGYPMSCFATAHIGPSGWWGLILPRAARELTPDLTDPPTVFALATIARKRLDACDADHGVTTARRDKLGQALAQWADGSLTLAGLAEALVEVLEAIEQPR